MAHVWPCPHSLPVREHVGWCLALLGGQSTLSCCQCAHSLRLTVSLIQACIRCQHMHQKVDGHNTMAQQAQVISANAASVVTISWCQIAGHSSLMALCMSDCHMGAIWKQLADRCPMHGCRCKKPWSFHIEPHGQRSDHDGIHSFLLHVCSCPSDAVYTTHPRALRVLLLVKLCHFEVVQRLNLSGVQSPCQPSGTCTSQDCFRPQNISNSSSAPTATHSQLAELITAIYF